MRLLTVLIAAALPLLAACSSEPSPPPAAATAATSSPATTAPDYSDEQVYGSRVELPGGLLLKQVGKVAEYGGAVRVVVESIDVDPTCDEYTSDPRRGHRVVLTLSFETSPDFDPATIPTPTYDQWSTISPDGVSESHMSSYYPCHEAQGLPSQFRPEAKYRGEVTIDTANPSGRVVLGDLFAWDY